MYLTCEYAISVIEDTFPCFVVKGILAFPSNLKMRRSQLETREELQGSCHNSKRPRSPNHSRETWLPCTDSTVTQRINSKHDGRCEEARQALTPRKESGLACLHSRRGQTPLWNLHRNPRFLSAQERKLEVPASTPNEDLCLGTNWRRIWEASHNPHGDWTFLRQHEQVPEIPVVT